jgi:cytidylate kinase
MDEILHSQLQRDQGDRNRPVGAMAVAIDAIIINTDGLSLDNVVKQILKFACDRGLISD